MNYLGVIIIITAVCVVKCDHFRGATFSWAPVENGTNITVTFRIAWEINRVFCDNTTIASGTLIGIESMTCSGCTGSGSLAFQCTDYKTGEWSSGGNSIVFTPSVNQFTLGFISCCWGNLQEGGSSWSLEATVDLSVRSDTGKINSSPTVDMSPILYWQQDCTYSYTLPVDDVDGDVIKCRWANGTNECADVCSSFSGLQLNGCTISNTANKSIGFYAVALQIEDFTDESSPTPLSSIPLQFLVNIYSGTGCPSEPELVSPTPEPDTQYVVDIGDTVNLTLKAQGPNTFHRIITMTAVTRVSEATSSDSSWQYITLNAEWTPTASETGQTHRICFYARDTIGVTSDTRCVTIYVTGNDNDNCDPGPCLNGGVCTDGLGEYNCACQAGYTDANCSTDIDECSPEPCENGGTCTDDVNDFTCACLPGYEGKNCSINIDECSSEPCENGGTCTDEVNDFKCACLPGYEGKNCSINIDECSPEPCENGGTCTDEVNDFTCACLPGYEGKNCSINIDECSPEPCENDGTCTDEVNDFTCACLPGYEGKNCSINIDECSPEPCENGGTCTDEVNDFTCACLPGYEGKNCSINIDECSPEPCENGGTCTDEVNDFTCACLPGYEGKNCSINIDECSPEPCENGGTCTDEVNDFTCACLPGYEGKNCSINIDECSSEPCENDGTCTDEVNDFTCACLPGYEGKNCSINIDECSPEPCENGGTCTDEVNDFTCACLPGYEGKNCSINIDECSPEPCENGGTCTDEVNDFKCACLPGYEGKNCSINIDECSPEPCENNGTCTDEVNDFTCACLQGYEGKNCSINIDECSSEPCENDGTCTDEVNDFTCACLPGYEGKNCSINIDECSPEPCENDGTCTDEVNDFTCACLQGYEGKNCSINTDECSPEPCGNNGTCTDEVNDFTCACLPGYEGKNCSINIDECSPEPCENGGTCTDEVNDFTCACLPGYEGKNCSINIDECSPEPCENDGTCTDEVNDFTCACLPGYEGKNCSINTDECSPEPCENNGTCTDEVNDFTCACLPGYEGKNCSINIDECSPEPCENGGICTDEVNDFTCACLPGYEGKNCSINIDECSPEPCENGGTCTDEVNDFTCACLPGYEGKNCSINIDECSPEPCENNGTCTDEVNDFTCACLPGYDGKNCSINIDECSPEPCENDGTCTDEVNDFTCACLPGYEGKNCSINIDECSPEPCENDGTCTDEVNNFKCACLPGYEGKNCSINIDECSPEPCENGGTCTDEVNNFTCACLPGYEGKNCSINIDECSPEPCENGGTCTDEVNDFTCACLPGYEGKNCSINIDECSPEPCENGGTCTDEVNDFTCACLPGYEGKNCSINIDECSPEPCENGGTCTDEVNDFTCACLPGYEGKNCSINIDECSPKPCENDGTCTDEANDFTCACLPGYEGKNCSKNIDECSPEPCENDGTCTDEVDDFTCACLQGYEGKNCSINIDECSTEPCENGGTCTDEVNNFTCACLPGYEGKNCSINIDECSPEPCENDGTCTDEVNDFTCACLPGYEGKNCSINIDQCSPEPCENGGTCTDEVNDFTCACLPGYEGKNCSINIDECSPEPCENDGTCTDEVNDFTCACLPGHEGKNCSINIDECSPEPCENDGTCTDEVNDFTCACLPGYEGKNCSKNIDECSPEPCENDGTCTDEVNDFTCACLLGYEGKNCSINIDECSPEPCENSGTCTDEVNDFTCACLPGYESKNCSINIDDCEKEPCENGGTCLDGINYYACTCPKGYSDKNCTSGAIEYKCKSMNSCRTSRASCRNGTCSCDPGIYNAMFDACDIMFLYPYGEEESDEFLTAVDDDCSKPIQFEYGIPVFDTAHTSVYVCTNGLLSLGMPYFNSVPPRNTSQFGTRTIVAPFFADTDTGQTGRVYFRHYDVLNNADMFENDDLKHVQSMIKRLANVTDFSAKFMLFATWHRMTPYQEMFNKNTEATFQTVLVTDGTDTYVLHIYGYQSMLWTMANPLIAKPDIWIGYTASGKYESTNINSFKSTALRMDTKVSTKGISAVSFNRLTPVGVRTENTAILCLDWYNKNRHTKSDFRDLLPDCPCSVESLSFDPWFWPTEADENLAIHTVEILPSTLFGHNGKSCAYNKTTGLWTDEIPNAGGFYIYHPNISLPEHVTHDIKSKDICCDGVRGGRLCNLYYELHPIGNCYTETWFETGTSWGDPHIKTLDKKEFTFNGLGEYTLLGLVTSEVAFSLQARTERPVKQDGILSYATIFTAFAAKDHTNASFHVERNKNKTGLNIYINNADLSLWYENQTSTRYKSAESNIAVTRKRDTLFVFFPNTGISLNVTVGAQMLSISATVPKMYKQSTTGLLGNFDGDPENDFISPNGSTLPGTLNEKEIFNYGQLWQIEDESSVFHYSERVGPGDFRNANYVPKFLVDAIRENKSKVEEADRICGGRDNIQCVFDYVFTEDEDVANNTSATKKIADEVSAEIRKRVPTLDGCDVLYITKGQEATCALSVSDEDGLSFTFIDNTVNATYDPTERSIVYSQDTDSPVKISISVVNKDNKASTPLRVHVRLCTGCSGHGNCTNNTRSDPRETEDFKYLKCICAPQYEGLDCEDEFDGCAASPCSMNRECTTLSAAEQKKMGKTHTCGECPDGFLEGDGDKCTDIDECGEDEKICQHFCENTEGSFECICKNGYRKNSRNNSRCDDINECDEALHNCTQECTNSNGGFICSCKDGFNFNSTSWACEEAEVNICDGLDIECSNTAGCTVDENSQPTCFCEAGFELSDDGTTCDDINECDSNVCTQVCRNKNGGFECSCHTGYMLQNGASCQECEFPFWGPNCANECKCTGQGALGCDSIRGCVCAEGWNGDACDDDINECKAEVDPCNDILKKCVNAPGSFTCTCREGYIEHDQICHDIDECSSPILNDCTQTCSNTVGGFTCGCYTGFTKYNRTYCRDIDECSLRQGNCEQRCANFPGLYNCYCHFGYTLNDDRKTCTKVSDPCKKELNLTCSHFCVLGVDSASCRCKEGFTLASDKQSCLDVDECAEDDLNLCSSEAECLNTDGSYLCKCPEGSKLDNNGRTCSVCDQYHYGEECAKSCSCLSGYCDRKTGCVCDPGWLGDNCASDADECTGNICTETFTECVNTPGSYICRCISGFENKTGNCKDIDECSDAKLNICDQKCVNTEGSYSCNCETGFAFKNGKCTDFDECKGVSECDHICDNTAGSYRCSCRDGYKLDLTDRQSCIPKSECNDTMKNVCAQMNAECTVINDEANCFCTKGFIFKNDICEDIHECSENPPKCSQNCSETNGGFICSCIPGFYLLQDGISCQECEKGQYGENCNSTCSCITSNTKVCHPVDGSCECNPGWKDEKCEVDVNECNSSTPVDCPDNSKCVNTNGSFFCECAIGYLKTSEGVCEDCERQHFGKDCLRDCSCERENTVSCDKINGSCTCRNGWTNENCTDDIDECQVTPDICLVKNHTVCHNTRGSYGCDCEDGYLSQNQECIDKNECLDGSADCLQECINTDGSYVCKCTVGHQGIWNICEACSGNKYGDNCTSSCECNTTNTINSQQSCDRKAGECLCKNEWEGETCDTDRNECLNDNVCATQEHTVCTNYPGTYSCECERGYDHIDGLCVNEEVATTTPAPDDHTELRFTVTFDVSLPSGVNLESATGFAKVSQMVYHSLWQYYKLSVKSKLIINDLRPGSIVVDYRIIYPSDDTALGDSLASDSVSLAGGGEIEFNGQRVSVRIVEPFNNETNVCDVYSLIRGPCPEATKCAEVDGKPTCREIVVEDKTAVYIGVGAGACFVLLTALIFIFCLRKLREKRQYDKEFKHIDRLHRNRLVHSPSDRKIKTEANITPNPIVQQPALNEAKEQNWRSKVWNWTRSQNFGSEKEGGMLPRFDISKLQKKRIKTQNAAWQRDFDLPGDFLY